MNDEKPIEHPELRIHDVVGGNVAWLEPLASVMLEYFPEAAGRISRLYERAHRPPDADPRFLHHQWLVEVGENAAGIAIFSYVPARNLGLGVYLIVRPAYRRLPIGKHDRLAGWLHEAILEQLAKDATAAGRTTPWGLAVEVSVPELVKQYARYGLMSLPVSYLEPHFRPCPPGEPDSGPRITWEPAQLGLFPSGPGVDPQNPQLLRDIISAFYIDHYGFAAEQPEVRRALQAVADAGITVESPGGESHD